VSDRDRWDALVPAILPETDGAEDDEQRAGSSGHLIQSVVMASAIIDALGSAAEPIRLTALAQSLGETKAKIHRHLATLKYLGLVEQDQRTERYRLGQKLAHLGHIAAAQFDLRQVAEPYMRKLRDLTQQTVVLSVSVGGDSVVSLVVESANLVTLSVRLGTRLPAHSSAQGRVNLAFAPEAVRDRVLARKLAPLTPRTIVDPAALRQRLARIRRELYDVAMDETMLGISAVAAPILNFHDNVVGVIAIVGTTHYVREPVDPEQLRYLQSCTQAISLKLNSSAYERLDVPMLKEFSFE
jgi:DNA-binding IclR family transcriptional regulator